MAGTCECGNEPSGFIICGEFHDYFSWPFRCCRAKFIILGYLTREAQTASEASFTSDMVQTVGPTY